MSENTKNDDGNIVDINRWRDFNDAAPQDPDSIAPMRKDFEIESTQGVKERLLRNLRGALAYLLPNGVIKGSKFVVGDVHGSRGDSLTVELAGSKAGLWHDFATSEGGDIISLWAAVTGRVSSEAFPDVMDDIRRWLGGPGPARVTRQAAAISGSKGQPPLDELGPITTKWNYLDDDGRLIAVVYRYDPPGGKQFRPWDVLARKARAPDPRPLYNRPGIKAASHVILVEGEKSADALIEQGICATTAMNGASAPVAKTDWSPLKGKRVLVWPDHDEPGQQYAHGRVAGRARGRRRIGRRAPPSRREAREMGRGRRGGRGHGRGGIHHERRAPGRPARQAIARSRRLVCHPLCGAMRPSSTSSSTARSPWAWSRCWPPWAIPAKA